MKRSLTALCLLLCLASAAAAQGRNANGSNANGASGNANANAAAGNANVNGPVTLIVQPGQTAKVEVGPQAEQPKGMDPFSKDVIDAIAKLLTFFSIGVAVVLAWLQFNKNREDRERYEQERQDRLDKDDKERRRLEEERSDRLDRVEEERKNDREQSERNRLQREDDVAQRRTELRWKKAQLAKQLLDEFNKDSRATDATFMLDWSGRAFNVKAERNQAGGERMSSISWEEVWAAMRITELTFNEKEKFIRDCFDAFFDYMQSIEHYISIELIETADVRHPFEYFVGRLAKNEFMYGLYIGEYFPRAGEFIKRLKAMPAREGGAHEPAPAPPAPTPPAVAYYLFDCPPRTERFVLKLEDGTKIKDARDVLSGKREGHVSGAVLDFQVQYNPAWQFHVDPGTVTFPDADTAFAEDVNRRVEMLPGKEKAFFTPDDIWHTGGARLLAELPGSRFDEEKVFRQENAKKVLREQLRVSEAAGAAPHAGEA